MSLLYADARQLPIADGVVNCCVTSPPYFGLRDYGNPNQIGLEPTPDGYVASLVDVFREVRRVLTDDGTVWLNLGDSYATQRNDHVGGGFGDVTVSVHSTIAKRGRFCPDGYKMKDLLGIPWRVAFALQTDGWYLRSDIIWSKPNPMPESVTDRPTKAHEYLFLLSKRQSYYYDAKAIAEPVSDAMLAQMQQGYDGLGLKDYDAAGVQNPSSVKARIIANANRKNEQSGDRRKVGFNDRWDAAPVALTRNRRTVWTINPQPFHGAHFATMPEALVEPCILAGCPLGGLVLDPFIGSGTVGAVAERLGRRWVGTDLNYQAIAKKRTAQRGLKFHEVPA